MMVTVLHFEDRNLVYSEIFFSFFGGCWEIHLVSIIYKIASLFFFFPFSLTLLNAYLMIMSFVVSSLFHFMCLSWNIFCVYFFLLGFYDFRVS